MTYDQAEQLVALVDALVAHRIEAERHRRNGEHHEFLCAAENAEQTRYGLIALLAPPDPAAADPDHPPKR